jgi:hypothetical protein
MKRLWVADGVLSLRVYFYSEARNVSGSAAQALAEKLKDDQPEWITTAPTEVLRADQIDSSDLRNDESVYLVGDSGAPDSLRGWIVKLEVFAEQLRQEQREAEAAARQLKLFRDDGT